TPEAFDRFLLHEVPHNKPSRMVDLSIQLLRPWSAVYQPGQVKLLQHEFNTWRPGPIAAAEKVRGHYVAAIEPWLEHLKWLFPDERERIIVLDFLSHLIQHRGD